MSDRTIRIITLIIGSILAILLFNFLIQTIPSSSSSPLIAILDIGKQLRFFK
jgi:hypothetical protein